MIKSIIVLCLCLTVIFGTTNKMKTVDVHESWKNYPSAEVPGESFEVDFSDIEETLQKMNDETILEMESEKRNYLLGKVTEILSNKEPDWEDFMEVGLLYAKNCMYKKSLEYLMVSVKMNSQNAEIYNNIGNIYYITRDDELAIKYYKKSLKYSKNEPLVMLNLAFIYYEMGKFRKARKCYLTAVTIEPGLDMPEYHVLSMESDDKVSKKASNKGISRFGAKWSERSKK